jgi:prevent-host-death family protein
MTGHLDWSYMKITATNFKAGCLALLDEVQRGGTPIAITKRGRVVANVVAAGALDERPWERVRGKARWSGDGLAPVVEESEIEALR